MEEVGLKSCNKNIALFSNNQRKSSESFLKFSAWRHRHLAHNLLKTPHPTASLPPVPLYLRRRASAGRLHILNQQRHVTRICIFENEGDGCPQGNLSQSQRVLFKPDGCAFAWLVRHGTGTPAQKINRPRRNQQSHYQTVF